MRTAHSRTAKVISTYLVAGVELKLGSADRDAVAVRQDDLSDSAAIHVRAVGALKVIERVAAEAKTDLRMLSRDATVVQNDVVLRITPDRERLVAEGERLAVPPVLHRERCLWSAGLLAEELLAVQHHG